MAGRIKRLNILTSVGAGGGLSPSPGLHGSLSIASHHSCTQERKRSSRCHSAVAVASLSQGNAAELDRQEKLNEPFPFVAKAEDVCTGPDDSIGIRTHTSRGSVDILHNLPPHTGDIKGPRWRHTAATPGRRAACVCVQHPSNGSGSFCCQIVFFMWRKIKSEAERIYVFAAPPPTLINNQIMGRRDE